MILLNNSELGKITKEQRSGGFDKFATDLHNPHFADYAKGCGALGIRIHKKAELDEALQQILSHRGTALLEIMSDVNLL